MSRKSHADVGVINKDLHLEFLTYSLAAINWQSKEERV